MEQCAANNGQQQFCFMHNSIFMGTFWQAIISCEGFPGLLAFERLYDNQILNGGGGGGPRQGNIWDFLLLVT